MADGFPKRRISAHRHHQQPIKALMFSPNGRQFASSSGDDGTINLWDGEDGARRANIQYSPGCHLCEVDVSNSMLAAAGDGGITLWDCKTLNPIQTFDGFFTNLFFSADGTLLAAATNSIITVFNVKTHTAIASFETDSEGPDKMAFLPDNSQLVVWLIEVDSDENIFYVVTSFSLLSEEQIRGPSFEALMQLPDMPLWHGVPVWVNQERDQYYLEALFSQHDDPVPVLWIPRELHARQLVQRRCMIAILCAGGRIVFLRLPTTATGTVARAGYDGNLSYGRPFQQIVVAALPYGQNMHVPTVLVRNEVQEDEGLVEDEAGGFTS
ncbi:hypothetical protein M378DRAFT_16676 [Amanita muscaria Koide BX008]|uniref:Uncharacterized protein n=1 Tax=Amanita muscaria (strain Koide BX008) TaxID=946122 RepID=A0A0C2SS77_AMAMK|nr:hypothetical protein M378DRAFT_16676 [Amanita muscaria Koide BX008]